MQNAMIKYSTLNEIEKVGTIMAKSGFFLDAKDSDKALAKILTGNELGFAPFASLTGINVIEGKLTLSANLMAAALRRYSGGIYDFNVIKLTNDECSIEFLRRNSINVEFKVFGVTSVFTTEDARTAGLLHRNNWIKYKRNMLFARAISNGIKWNCPEVFVGHSVYHPDELDCEVDEDDNIVKQKTPIKDVTAVKAVEQGQSENPKSIEEVKTTVKRKAVPEQQEEKQMHFDLAESENKEEITFESIKTQLEECESKKEVTNVLSKECLAAIKLMPAEHQEALRQAVTNVYDRLRNEETAQLAQQDVPQ